MSSNHIALFGGSSLNMGKALKWERPKRPPSSTEDGGDVGNFHSDIASEHLNINIKPTSVNIKMHSKLTEQQVNYLTTNDTENEHAEGYDEDEYRPPRGQISLRKDIDADDEEEEKDYSLMSPTNAPHDSYLFEQTKRHANKIKHHDKDMKLMNAIIHNSEHQEKGLLNKIGEAAFTSVAKYNRGVKRTQERDNVKTMLQKIETRTINSKTLATTRKENSSGLMSSKKTKWIDDSKEKARKNFLMNEQIQRVEDITIKAQIQHENTVEQYKHQIEMMMERQNAVLAENKKLQTNIGTLTDEVSSLKYTIELMRQKMQKLSSREVENEQKLKLFSDYEPLFDDLKKNFNFTTPKQVIKRMELLEKAQSDSYTQLLEAQEQRNELERKLEHTRKDLENKHREKVVELNKHIEKNQKRSEEMHQNVETLEKTLQTAQTYKIKYTTLSNALTDLWNTWIKDVERTGFRDDIAYDEPDPTDSTQLLSSLKNILIAFTPTKAGKNYIELSKMSHNYWLKYFKDELQLKSKPVEIFTRLGEYLDLRENQLKMIQKQAVSLKTDRKDLLDKVGKVQREKLAVENQLKSVRSINERKDSIAAGMLTSRSNQSGSIAPTPMSARRKYVQSPPKPKPNRPSSAPTTRAPRPSRPGSATSTRMNSARKRPSTARLARPETRIDLRIDLTPTREVIPKDAFFITQQD